MIYASSKDRFKRELDGIQVELQATDPTEMGLDVFKSRANWTLNAWECNWDSSKFALWFPQVKCL